MLFGKKRLKEPRIIFRLQVDFGFEKTSPIPSNRPVQKNFNTVVLAIPGACGELFPGKRTEAIEFLDYIDDNKGDPCGIRCKVREYSKEFEKILNELGIAQNMEPTQYPETELELLEGKPVFFESSSFENGVTTYRYRGFRLERIESGKDQEQLYWRSGNLFHEK